MEAAETALLGAMGKKYRKAAGGNEWFEISGYRKPVENLFLKTANEWRV